MNESVSAFPENTKTKQDGPLKGVLGTGSGTRNPATRPFSEEPGEGRV
jgi:hypothetical protein